METILLHSRDGVNFRPIKGTTKQQCYNVLGKIQSLLKTNVVNINTTQNEYECISENIIAVNGNIYKAVLAPNLGYCDGCDFLPNGEKSCGGLWQKDERMPFCSTYARNDERDVIWKSTNQNINTMKKQEQYRIVCDIEGNFSVQQYLENNWSGSWWEVHRCENKNEAGLNEARKWIDEQ